MKFGLKLGSKKYEINEKLIELFGDDVAQKVIEKTGPTVLYHCDDTENSLTLGVGAIESLIKYNEIDISSVQNLICVTETPIYLFPGNSPFLISKFSFNKNISFYDINSGCTGFVDALKIALSFNTDSLIVCSETYSKHIHEFNRATSSLFSDGACAIYIKKNDWKLIKSYAITIPDTFDHISVVRDGLNLKMDGKEVYNFVACEVAPEIIKIHEANQGIDRTYLHQGSKLVTDLLKIKLKNFDPSIPTNIKDVGNLVSATIPILIQQDNLKKPIQKGEKILIASFGVGLYFSACVLEKF
jgi:3-oxoacyl-[acyl-carrier-protein] synthase-3